MPDGRSPIPTIGFREIEKITLVFSTINILAAVTVAIATVFIAFQGPTTVVLQVPEITPAAPSQPPLQHSDIEAQEITDHQEDTADTWLISAVKTILVFYGFALAALATVGFVAASLPTEQLDVTRAVDLVSQTYWNDVVITWFWIPASPIGVFIGATTIIAVMTYKVIAENL